MAHGTPDEPGSSPWEIPGQSAAPSGGAPGGHLPSFGQFAPADEPTQAVHFPVDLSAAEQPTHPQQPPSAAFGQAYPYPPAVASYSDTSYSDSGYSEQPRLLLQPPQDPPHSSGSTKRRKTILLSALAAASVVGVALAVTLSGGDSPQHPVALTSRSGTQSVDPSSASASGSAASPGSATSGAPMPAGSIDRGGSALAGSTPTGTAATGPASANPAGAVGAPKPGAVPGGPAASATTVPAGSSSQGAPPPLDSALLLHWKLNDPSGSVAVADSSNHGLSGTVAGPVTFGSAHGGSATFTGQPGQIKAGQITAPGPVVDTAKSFTVSAWVDQTAFNTPTKYASALGQDGKVCSAFSFTWAQDMKTWAFSRSTSDVSAAVTDDAWAPTPAPMNAWLLLTGVYDANAGTISLYFNGTLQKTVPTRTAPWASSGPFEVGRSWYNSYPSNPFTGGVSDVRVYNRALTAPEVQSLTHA